MSGPVVTIDLDKIESNSRAVVDFCRGHGIQVTGVTKATCGMPQVARAMLAGGVSGIGESRLKNVQRLRASGINAPLMLLRIPPLSMVDDIVGRVDISLNSEFAVIKALSRAAEKRSIVHDIILMVDLGDLREGVWPDELLPLAEQTVRLPGVRIVGLGTNLTCYGGVLPSEENMGALVEHARSLEQQFDLRLRYISGGNSSSLPLVAGGRMPPEVNHLRIGEAILLGRETIHRNPWPGTVQDAFLLTAELIELKAKPSVPIGQLGEDAFGGKPVFEDQGTRLRGILNVGREDIVVEGMTPVRPGISILGASSDHLLIDVTDMKPPAQLGADISFQMNYAALLAAMTSEFVMKDPVRERHPLDNQEITIIGESELLSAMETPELIRRLDLIGKKATPLPIEAPAGVAQQACDRYAMITQKVADSLREQHTSLLLGENHRSTYAALAGLAKTGTSLGLIWLDAGASFMPPENDVDPAASVLSRALGYGAVRDSLQPHLSAENVVLIGLRTVDPREAQIIDRSRVTTYTMEDVDALGIKEVMRQSIRIAAAGTGGFCVSLCPEVTESLSLGKGAGGLTHRETYQSLEIIAQSGLMRALCVSGLSASQDQRLSAEVQNFIVTCFGKRVLAR